MAIDILGAVYDFVQTYAWQPSDERSKQYTDEQIVRGIQNAAVLPHDTVEFCVLTLTQTIRHGTNVERYAVQVGEGEEPTYKDQYREKLEHIIQIDFCSAEPYQDQEVTAERASIIEMLSRSHIATSFFKTKYNTLNCLYSEDVQNMTRWDDTKNYTSRFSVRLHLEEILLREITSEYFTQIDVKTAPAHAETERENQPGFVLTENVDNLHS